MGRYAQVLFHATQSPKALLSRAAVSVPSWWSDRFAFVSNSELILHGVQFGLISRFGIHCRPGPAHLNTTGGHRRHMLTGAKLAQQKLTTCQDLQVHGGLVYLRRLTMGLRVLAQHSHVNPDQ